MSKKQHITTIHRNPVKLTQLYCTKSSVRALSFVKNVLIKQDCNDQLKRANRTRHPDYLSHAEVAHMTARAGISTPIF